MKHQRPYLFDAIYRWIIDNGCTPHLLVDTNVQGVQVPLHLVHDSKIVLNINPSAIANFYSSELSIGFSARFSGKSQEIVVPFAAMSALFAKENNEGLVFPKENFDTTDLLSLNESAKSSNKPKTETLNSPPSKKPTLKIIK